MLSKFSGLFTKSHKSNSKIPTSQSIMRRSILTPTPNNYASLATEGYLSNVYVRRCVNIIANAVQAVPIVAKNAKGELLPDAHELAQLMARFGGGQHMAEAISYLQLSGNLFMEVVRTESGRAVELVNIRPDLMTKRTDGTFLYKDKDVEIVFQSDEIIHVSLFNPLSNLEGASPISAARRAIDAHNAASDHNIGTLQNSASPTGILQFDGVLSDEDFTKLQHSIKTSWTGANSKLPKLLDAGLKFQPLSYTNHDLEWLSGKELAATEIATAFGVPIELLGLGNTTYSNKYAAITSFYGETIAPLMEQLVYEMSHVLAADGNYLDPDYSEVPSLQEQEEVKIEKTKALRGIATINELRQIWGLDTVANGDVIIQPQQVSDEGS